MARKDGCGRAGFGSNGHQSLCDQAVGILRKPEFVLLFSGNEPFEQRDAKASFEAAADHAHRRQKIPDIGPFEGGRDDEEHRPLVNLAAMVGS